MQPRLTVSGYRGIWGKTLTEEIALDYARAFALFVQARNGKTILIGRDGRESGSALLESITTQLLALGFNVVDLGLVATPVVVFLVRNEKADGAIIITASHNPIEYNGLKFVTGSGAFTTETEVAEIESLRGASPKEAPRPGIRTDGTPLFEKYFSTLLSNINVESIKSKNFKAALDPINSVGCTTTPSLLEKLGTSYGIINGEPDGKFAHEPEPLAKNLTGLQTLVREKKCDVGFAQDPDGDRLVICDETGTIPTEETMLALCLKSILSKTPGDIVINLSTSNMSEDVAATFGQKTFRSKVGEANVVKMMVEKNAIAGGEGGGGIIWPVVNVARDSYVGIALILELMAQEQKPLSQIINTLPKYSMLKEKISFAGNLPDLYTKIQNLFPSTALNTLDGLRLDFPDRSWIHVRPSNTEPIVRIIAEAKTENEVTKLIAQVKAL